MFSVTGSFGLDVFGQLDDVVRVLDAQHFEHLPMELTHIIQLRRLLSELQRSLILHHTLRHRGGIRVRHRNNIDATIKVLHPVEVIVRVVGVLLGHIVMDNPSDQTQLTLHRSMQAGLNPGHHLHRPLKQGQCGAHGGLWVHVAYLDVRHGADATALLDHIAEQLVQDARGLFIWQREQGVPDRSARYINIAPLTRHEGSIVALDTHPFGLEASGQVGQRASVDQLAEDGCGALRKATDQMHEASAVEAKTRQVGVVDEVVALILVLVVLVPITADRQDGARTQVNGDHIGTCDAIGIVEGLRHVVVDVHLEDGVPVVVVEADRRPVQFVILLLNVAAFRRRCREIDVAVEALRLQLPITSISGFSSSHGYSARSTRMFRRAIGDRHEVLSRDKHGDRTPLHADRSRSS
jgi:hypothetical protein